MNILLAEDDPFVAEVLQDALKDGWAAAVRWVGNGSEAMEALRASPPDLAIIDAVLPGVSGFDVAQSAADAQIPALMISGDPDTILRCRSRGFAFLEKPFSSSQLIWRAAEVVQQSQANRAQLQRSRAALAETVGQLKRERAELAKTVRRTEQAQDRLVETASGGIEQAQSIARHDASRSEPSPEPDDQCR